MKIYKKIIASLVLVVVLVSTFVMLAPSASAATVNNTDYKVRLLKTVSYQAVDLASWEVQSYISVSTYEWKLEGEGRYGYNKDNNTYYIQIDKYAGANGSWLLKLDSTRYWQYRDGLDDYGTMHSTFHSMKDEPKDIFVSIKFYEDQHPDYLTYPAFKNLFEDITDLKGKTINFYRDGLKYKTLTVYSSYPLPTPDPRPGYEFLYYDNRDGIFRNPGETEIYIDDRTVHYYEVWKFVHTDFIFCLDDDFSKIDTCDKIIYKDQDAKADFVIPEFPKDKLPSGKGFSHWVYYSEAYGNTFDPGNKMTPLEAEHIFVPVFVDLKGMTIDFYLGGAVYKTITVYDDYVLPTPTRDGYTFSHYEDNELNIYHPGDKITYIDGATELIAEIWDQDDKDMTFIAGFYDDWGVFESCYVSVPVGDTLTFPELPDLSKFGLEATRWYSGDYSYYPGDIVSYDDLLDRYGRETTFYVDYNEHIVYPDDPPTIDPDDTPTINPDGTDGDGNNFIVSFFFDTFDRTKELCSPYLTSFEIPFLGITLAEVIEFIFFGLIAWFVIIIISKVIGAIK